MDVFLSSYWCLPILVGLPVVLFLWSSGIVDFEVIKMEPGNRMVRAGFGQNNYRWFFRIDLWFFGIRASEGKFL